MSSSDVKSIVHLISQDTRCEISVLSLISNLRICVTIFINSKKKLKEKLVR